MSFERIYRGCGRRRSFPGTYPCQRCKTATQTAWRRVESDDTRVCVICERRPAEGIEPVCGRCLRGVARHRERKLREARQDG